MAIALQDTLEAGVKRLMADVLDLDAAAIDDDTSVDNTAGWDSARHIHLVLALEDEFGVSFDVMEMESMLSFFDIMQVMRAKA